MQGRYHGCEAGPKLLPILRLSTPRLGVILATMSASSLSEEMINVHTFPLCAQLNAAFDEPACMTCDVLPLPGMVGLAVTVALFCATASHDVARVMKEQRPKPQMVVACRA